MDQFFIPTLAEGWIEVVGPLVLVGIFVLSSVIKGIAKQKEDNSQRPIRKADNTTSSAERFNDLAEKRRRQLQELANQRRHAQERQQTRRRNHVAGGGATTRRRSATPPPVQAKTHAADDPQMSGGSLEKRMREAERLRRAKVEADTRRRRTTEEKRVVEHERKRREVELQRQRKLSQRMAVHDHAHVQANEATHRHVPDAAVPISDSPAVDWVAELDLRKKSSLRKAIVLKEIFDKPIALRSQNQSMWDV